MKSAKMIILICLCLALSATGSRLNAATVDMTFDHYYDHNATVDALQRLHKAYPDLTDLEKIGVSEEGRDIWMLTVFNPATGADTEKPGIYVDGAIHGNEIQATEVCLYLAWYLLEKYDEIPMVKDMVDTRSFYIVPIVNVDNRARFFEDPSGYNIGRSARVPYDDDRDGLVDEDDYEDIDGDGEILRMRIKDPDGRYKSHPDDPRVMVRVEPWEKGEWTLLGSEGIDNDGDGRINEDVPGYLDMNRNFGFNWQPQYVQSGAGDFPLSANPTEAVASVLVSKTNICFGFNFHNMGGMILRGPGSDLSPPYNPRDIAVYDYLGGEGEKIIPGYRYLVSKDDLYTTYGDFDEFLFSNLGIYAFVGELFMSSQEQYRKPGEEAVVDDGSYESQSDPTEKQKFNDIVNQGVMFKDWTLFTHPQLGEIEIGGWRTFTTRISPPFMLPEMVHRNASLVMFTARHAPDITLEVLDVKPLGNDLHRIRIRATNAGAIPSVSTRAVNKNIFRKDIFSISGSGFEVISGGTVDDVHFDRVDYVEHRPEFVFSRVDSFGSQIVQWIVKGSGRATISYEAMKAANREITVSF